MGPGAGGGRREGHNDAQSGHCPSCTFINFNVRKSLPGPWAVGMSSGCYSRFHCWSVVRTSQECQKGAEQAHIQGVEAHTGHHPFHCWAMNNCHTPEHF